MPQELISECPKMPGPLVSPIKMGTIRGLITRNQAIVRNVINRDKIKGLLRKNQITVTSLLILTPSIGVPAYLNYDHPVIGGFLGALVMAGFTVSGLEQMVNAEGDSKHFKRKDDLE